MYLITYKCEDRHGNILIECTLTKMCPIDWLIHTRKIHERKETVPFGYRNHCILYAIAVPKEKVNKLRRLVSE